MAKGGGFLLLAGLALAGLAAASGQGGGGSASCQHLERLWDRAGGSSSMAETMASIAMAESSGDAGATSSVGAEGFWQIDPAAWPKLATYDPLGNAKGAVIILRKQGLEAWTSYTNGSYAGRC